MSQKVTFSNEQFCEAWKAAAVAGESRMAVVVALMAVNAVEDTKENRRKMYNNVTQRYRVLSTKHGLNFPSLAAGKKGLRRIAERVEDLQQILNVQ